MLSAKKSKGKDSLLLKNFISQMQIDFVRLRDALINGLESVSVGTYMRSAFFQVTYGARAKTYQKSVVMF